MATMALGAMDNFRPGDWMCPCGGHNYASKSACFKCNMAKETATGNSSPYQRHDYHMGYGGMGGINGNLGGMGMNHMNLGGNLGMNPLSGLGGMDMASLAAIAGMDVASLQTMMSAYGLYPAPHQVTPPNFRVGDWMCTCGNHNYASRVVCAKCGMAKSLIVSGRGVNNLPPNFRVGDWLCKCGNHNYQSRTACGKCREPKETSDRTGVPNVMSNFQVGDWMCTCGAHNYQSKTACYKCHLPKESGQVDAGHLPAQSHPSFYPGDWICASCNNHNYASRVVCGRCKGPKVARTTPPLSQ